MDNKQLSMSIKKLLSQVIIETKSGFVITNGKEWYAGSKNYVAFAKVSGESNLYPTYEKAKHAIEKEIPQEVVKTKQLKIKNSESI